MRSFFKFFLFKYSILNIFLQTFLRISLSSRLYKFNDNSDLETVWTVIPTLIVLSIAVPSFFLLYSLDVVLDCSVHLKVIGHQWYWSYELEYFKISAFTSLDTLIDLSEDLDSVDLDLLDRQNSIEKTDIENYSDFFHYNYDSYMIADSDLLEGQFRLLEVDKLVYLPEHTNIDIVITSNDVIHSWAVPSLGVKVDAVPGRLNHISLFIEREGLFYGQCSELCGVNHAFMPIQLLVLNSFDYNIVLILDLFSKDIFDYLFE